MRIFWIIALLVLIQGLWQGCSPFDGSCENDISRTALDPNGLPCSSRCECNNQNFEGYCTNGRCIVAPRNECREKGLVEKCNFHLHFDRLPKNCKEGIRVCGDTGLALLSWGDCHCPTDTAPSKAD